MRLKCHVWSCCWNDAMILIWTTHSKIFLSECRYCNSLQRPNNCTTKVESSLSLLSKILFIILSDKVYLQTDVSKIFIKIDGKNEKVKLKCLVRSCCWNDAMILIWTTHSKIFLSECRYCNSLQRPNNCTTKVESSSSLLSKILFIILWDRVHPQTDVSKIFIKIDGKNEKMQSKCQEK